MNQSHKKKGKKTDNAPYVDRDISWMYFNSRILQEAQRDDVPVLERLSFLGIYSSNLDEFFRIRMATISRIAEIRDKGMESQRIQARDLFGRLSSMDMELSSLFADAMGKVKSDLEKQNIFIIDETQLDESQKHYVRCIFREKISGFVSPVWLSHLSGFAKESDDQIYLAVELSGKKKMPAYAVIELPAATCGRFVCLPRKEGQYHVMFLDDVIRFCLPMIFPETGYTESRAYSFKFTKDAEMEIDNDLHMGPLEKIAKAVRSRKKGTPLRVLYDREMPEKLLGRILERLKLNRLDTVGPSGRYQNHKDLMGFPCACRPDLKYPEWKPLVRSELKGNDSLIRLVRKRDRFIQVPYHSFDYVIRLLQEAAVSTDVKTIRITLYRLARNSRIVEALKCAARNGKKVTTVVELLARFNEASNINYAKEMQEAGINVLFGVESLKVHSKIIHIGMKKGKDIALVGTGNFHEGNARLYTDYFLMTADPRIVREVESVFGFIKRPFETPSYRHLLVSPLHMRHIFDKLIDREIANADRGREAWIKAKVNHITDEHIVKRLYEASSAGVRIDLLVRGNCSIVTGIPGVSDNIHIAGIIDRYLEHARLFVFCAGGENLTYIGSADWMPRNLDHRVEVVAPVYDPEIKHDIMNTINYGQRDSTHARIVDGSGENRMREIPGEPEAFRSQEELYRYYSNFLNREK